METNRPGMINLCAVLALAVSLAAAPQENAAASPAVAGPRLIPFETLVHAPVVVNATTPSKTGEGTTSEKGEKSEQVKDTPARLTVVGTLRDIVIDTETNKSTLAIVDTSDGGRALPLHQLEWDDADRQWILREEDAMKKAMPCDGVNLAGLHRKHTKDTGVGEKEGSETVDVSAAGISRRDPSDARYVLTSLFGRRELRARDGRAGAGLGVVFEVRAGALAFLRVAAGRGDFAVPFTALRVTGPAGAREPHLVHVDMDKATLDTAPLLGKDPKWMLDNAKFRAELYRFFGVPTPAFDSAGSVTGSVGRDG